MESNKVSNIVRNREVEVDQGHSRCRYRYKPLNSCESYCWIIWYVTLDIVGLSVFEMKTT